MESYNRYSKEYELACKSYSRQVLFKVELLDHYENLIYEITNDITGSSAGSISANMQNGIRRTCSFSLVDLDNKYSPSENSEFWINRKFKIYIGLKHKDDIFWWEQGVFITKSATQDNEIVNIEGVDKFAFFTSDLNQRFTTADFIIPESGYFEDDYKGQKIYMSSVVKDILVQDMGNGYPIDVISPNIDKAFSDTEIQYQMSLQGSGYYEKVFEEISNNYLVEYYYDRAGVFTITKNKYIEDYQQLTPCWTFTDDNGEYNGLSSSYEISDVVNSVTAYCNTADKKFYSYTFRNDDPHSPIRVSKVGIKAGDDVEIQNADSIQLCKERAEYETVKSSVLAVTHTLNSIFLPHLKEGDTIVLTNKKHGIMAEQFLITSIEMPLGVGEMSLTISNISCLPRVSEGDSEYIGDAVAVTDEDKLWRQGTNLLELDALKNFNDITKTYSTQSGKSELTVNIKKIFYKGELCLDITLNGQCDYNNRNQPYGAFKRPWLYIPIFPLIDSSIGWDIVGCSDYNILNAPRVTQGKDMRGLPILSKSNRIAIGTNNYLMTKTLNISGTMTNTAYTGGQPVEWVLDRLGIFGYTGSDSLQEEVEDGLVLKIDNTYYTGVDNLLEETFSSLGGNFFSLMTDSQSDYYKEKGWNSFLGYVPKYEQQKLVSPYIYHIGICLLSDMKYDNVRKVVGFKLVKQEEV